jgi:hypothetical protein
MTPILRLTAVLIPILSLVTGAIMIMGGRTNPDWSRYFGDIEFVDGRVSFMGIVPGRTRVTDAVNVLRSQNATITNTTPDAIAVRFEKRTIGLAREAGGQTVLSLTIYARDVPWGAVLMRMGVPCRTRIWGQTGLQSIVYPHLYTEVSNPNIPKPPDPFAPVERFVSFGVADNNCNGYGFMVAWDKYINGEVRP